MSNDHMNEIYKKYGINPKIDPDRFTNLLSIYSEAITEYQDAPAFSCMGRTLSFNEFDQMSEDFAAYLQSHTGLQKGDRIAVMLPNILQQPVSVYGILRSGLVLVNTNPLYTARELEHQLNDSGAKAVVVLANMASVLEEVLPKTGVEHVILTEVGDLHSPVKRLLINSVVKYVKKAVPKFNLPKAVSFNDALKLGADASMESVSLSRDDIAVLQYTGGTTGLSKGAILSHNNLMSNGLQMDSFMDGFKLSKGSEIVIQPLPLYHIYAFTMTLCMLNIGAHNVLIPNPRDLPGMIKELGKIPFTVFCGLNTLFVALFNNEDFRALDFSPLKMTVSGGMALTQDTAEQWKKVTGRTISEGYGLTEASPVVTFNPGGGERIGSIGIALPLTDLKLVDDDVNESPAGESGELCVRGPQVMSGYWNNEEATANTIKDGWLLTGDIAMIGDDGFVRIVDRKKDMILVSGFNVYPNEIEDQLTKHPDIIECAAVGVPDETSGEVVKVYAVKVANSKISEEDVITFARDSLTAYKVPKMVEFREELPKSNVGKILRRHLRDETRA